MAGPVSEPPVPSSPDEEGSAAPSARTARQKHILQAAMACFARDGFHGTSMQKICAEAGMSPGALYRYFPSKESLIAAIVSGERSERLCLFHDLENTSPVLPAMLETMAEILREPRLPTARLGPEIMAEAIRNRPLRDAVEPVEQETRDLLLTCLRKAVRIGEVDSTLDLDDVLIMLQAMGDGLVLHHQLHPEWRLDERMGQLGILLHRMLAPHPATDDSPGTMQDREQDMEKAGP